MHRMAGSRDVFEHVFADPDDPASLLPPLPHKRGDHSTLHVFEKIERNDSVASEAHESGEILIVPNSSIVSRARHGTKRIRRSS